MKKAIKEQSKLRMAVSGASGSGKTYSALSVASCFGDRVGVIDTERGSARKYSRKFNFDVEEFSDNYNPERLIAALKEHAPNYDILVVDSFTHFWNAQGGILDLVENEAKRMQAAGGKYDTYAAWKVGTKIYNKVIQAMMTLPCHLIVTMRAKQQYERKEKTITKIGVEPEMRDGFDYEFDLAGLLNHEHDFIVQKSRLDPFIVPEQIFNKPGKEFADLALQWLNEGETPAPREPEPAPPAAIVNTQLATFLERLRVAGGDRAVIDAVKDEAKAAYAEKRLSVTEWNAFGSAYKAAVAG
jgi:AAA domain